MVFARISAIVSKAANRISTKPISSAILVSSGLAPQTGSNNGFDYPYSEQINNLRHVSSLQDLSAYQHIDPEEGDYNPAMDRNMSHAKPPHPLQRENGGSSFSKEKATSGTSHLQNKWVRVIMVLLCLLLFTFLIYTFSRYYYSTTSKFYVVLDCGSTGTRVFVYQATIDHNKHSSLPITVKSFPVSLPKEISQNGRAYDRMETEPGFDKLVHNISGLKKVIKPLLKWAKKQIPRHAHKTTSLYLYATAGVRRLPTADSEWILNNAWSILQSSPFLCKKEWVKTITGMEEAYYGWVALNYRTGMLGSMPKKPTFGALDLGGSSLQVTFEGNDLVGDETSLNLRVGSVNHHLNAYSLPRYGLNDAFDKSVISLLNKVPSISNADLVNGKIELNHPCLHTGYKEKYNCLQCATSYQESGSPVVGGKSRKKTGTPIQLIGTPNWEQCIALAKVAVNLSEWSNLSHEIDCELQPCALPETLPRPYGHFYAMSGFFVVYRFFNLTSEAALDDVLEKGRQFCGKTWEAAKSSVTPQPFIEQYCFRAPYIVSLLREGLHIVDGQVNIGSGSITWTLGVALLEAGKEFSTAAGFNTYEIFKMEVHPIVICASLLISLIFLVCALCAGGWMPRFLRTPYLPLFKHNTVSTASVLNIPSPFRFQRWSPISPGDGRVKTPLSPTVAGTQHADFGIQLAKSSLYPSSSSGCVPRSYSSSSLVQMHFDNSAMYPQRGRLQSRRSQSREDLSMSMSDAHTGKV